MRPVLVAGLDVGSTKTAVVIAEVSGDAPHRARVKILGVGQARTSGMRREIVTDIEATTESVRKAVKEAELMAGVTVETLYTGIAGEHIHGRASSGVVAVGSEEITLRDVERVHEVARAIVVPADREVLHAIPQEYIVDAQGGIRDPVGMAGTRLEAEVFIVTGSSSAAQNIRKSVTRAGYRVEELVLEPIASSMATLSEDEMEIGVALVELGGGTTDVAIFHERKIHHLASLPWGGATVTNDIVKGLSLPYAEATRVKERWGTARAAAVDPHETFEFSAAAPGQTRHIARELLAHIIEQRMDEIFSLVGEQIEKSGFGDRLGGGIVLTGGGAALDSITYLAEQIFAGPVRVGVPGESLGGLVDSVRRPKFATATGLVRYGARRILSEHVETGGAAGGRPVNGVIKWMRDWLTDFF
ncbi:cell division protein FtsA [soil metagenome]|jgi:cell division protein FtsA|nr:cell division protein FtsA [Gemmatimonadota bacterium]